MTKFSKLFVLFSTILSLAFLGFASVQLTGGKNWKAEAATIEEYQFTQSTGENPQWSAAKRYDQEAVGSPSPVLAKKIIDVQKQIIQEETEKRQRIEAGIAEVDKQLAESKQLIDIDSKAIEVRQSDLEQQLKELTDQISKAQEQSVQVSRETRATQAEMEDRRDDVSRLKNELEALRTDHSRSIQQYEKLADLLIQLQGNNIRLEERNRQLKQKTGS